MNKKNNDAEKKSLTEPQKIFLKKNKIQPTAPHQLDLLFPETIANREDLRHLPNDFARSSLFSIAPRGIERKKYTKQVLFSVDPKVDIAYDGEELRAADDELVWLQLLKYAEGVPFGHCFKFSISQLVQDIGWQKSGKNYDAARNSIHRLRSGMVWIDNCRAFGKSVYLNLLDYLLCLNNEEGKRTEFSASIARESILLFAGNHFTSHKWLTYRSLTPTARRLADYAASHQNPFPLSLEDFRKMCGSASVSPRKWKQQTKNVLIELTEVKLFTKAEIKNDMIICERVV